MAKGKIDEKKRAAAHYIISLYNEVQSATQQYAIYYTQLVQFKGQYGADSDKMKPEEKDILSKMMQEIRYHVIMSYTGYSCVMKSLPGGQKTKDSLTKSYLKVREQVVIKSEDLENYILELNTAFMESVVQDLLKNSNVLVAELYSAPQGAPEAPQSEK